MRDASRAVLWREVERLDVVVRVVQTLQGERGGDWRWSAIRLHSDAMHVGKTRLRDGRQGKARMLMLMLARCNVSAGGD